MKKNVKTIFLYRYERSILSHFSYCLQMEHPILRQYHVTQWYTGLKLAGISNHNHYTADSRMHGDEEMYPYSHSDLIHLDCKRPGVGEEERRQVAANHLLGQANDVLQSDPVLGSAPHSDGGGEDGPFSSPGWWRCPGSVITQHSPLGRQTGWCLNSWTAGSLPAAAQRMLLTHTATSP